MKNIDREKLYNRFQLLKEILQTGFDVDSSFMEYPYDDINAFDHGIRSMMWGDYDKSEMNKWLERDYKEIELNIIKSNLGFYNFTIIVPQSVHPLIISAGPFKSENLSRNYLESALKTSGLSSDKIDTIEKIFRRLPQVEITTVVNISKRIMSEADPSIATLSPNFIEFSDTPRVINPNSVIIDEVLKNFASGLQENLLLFENSLMTNDLEKARSAIRNILLAINFEQLNNIAEKKNVVHLLNNFALYTLFSSSVNPVHSLRLFNKIRDSILATNSITDLSYMPYDLCHKYGILLRNYGFSDYSKITREVIDYIYFHLDEEISLATIASHFGRNPSSLSTLFKKETGQSLTDYIKQLRVREAIKLLNTTNNSISEIALAVGYSDFAYFSRIFKQIIGISPREYRENNH